MDAEPYKPSAKPERLTGREWGLILVLVAVQFTHVVDFVILMPLGKRLIEDPTGSGLKLTTEQFGTVLSAYAWAALLATLAAGVVMDRLDRRNVILTMYAGFGVSTLFCGLAWSYESLLVSRFLAGVFGGVAATAIMTTIGDVFSQGKRGRANGAVMSAFAVASVTGLPLGLTLARWYGFGAPFIALAGLSLVVWVVAFVRLPAVRGHITAVRANRWTEYLAVAREGNHQRAFLFTFFLVLGMFTVASFAATYLSFVNGWGEGELTVIYLVAGACTLVGMHFIGRLADRVARRPLFLVLGGFSILMALAVANLPPVPLWVAAAVFSLFMLAASGRMVPAQTMLLSVAAPRVRGSFIAMNTAVQHAGTALAPMIAGSLVEQTPDGKMTGFPLVGLAAAASAGAALALAMFLRPAKVATPTVVVSAQVPVPVESEPKPAAV